MTLHYVCIWIYRYLVLFALFFCEDVYPQKSQRIFAILQIDALRERLEAACQVCPLSSVPMFLFSDDAIVIF